MSEKHLPRHRRSYSKEFHTAIRIINYLKSGRILLPTPIDLDTGKLADVVALGMRTVKPEEIRALEAATAADNAGLDRIIED